MGYFTWALIVLLINVAIIAFLAITYFKEVMDYMAKEGIAYSNSSYDPSDNRHWMLIIVFLASSLLSWLVWPVMLVGWAVGILYLAMKQNDKFKRIIEILKEDVKKTE